MRLSKEEIEAINEAVKANLDHTEVFIFGSRVNDDAHGGDIDILIITKTKYELTVKWQIRDMIKQKIGNQKIDIVNLTYDDNSNFKKLILENAVKI